MNSQTDIFRVGTHRNKLAVPQPDVQRQVELSRDVRQRTDDRTRL